MDYNSRQYDKLCSTFSDYNEYVVNGWMVNKLGLKGNELVVFALIHAYSQEKRKIKFKRREYE